MRVWRVANDLDTKLNLWDKLRALRSVCWRVSLTKNYVFRRFGSCCFTGRAFSGSVTSILRSVIFSRAACLAFLVEQLYVQMTSNFHRITSYPFLICHINDSCQLRDLPGYLLVLKRLNKLNLIIKFELRRDSHTTEIRLTYYMKNNKL